MYYLGLDLSLRSTGVYLLHDNEEYKLLLKANTTEWYPRMSYISSRIIDLLEPEIESTFVLLEDYAYAARGRVFSIGELGGIVKWEMLKNGVKEENLWICPPTTLKKYVTGKGNSKKNVMLQMVYKKWGKELKSDDIADAYALARMARDLHSNGSATLKYEEEALKALRAYNQRS